MTAWETPFPNMPIAIVPACAKGAGFAMYVVLFIDFLVRLYIVVLYTYETRSGRFRRIMMNSVTR